MRVTAPAREGRKEGDKDADAAKEETKEQEVVKEIEMEEEEDDYHLSKNLPMTLEYMKMLDERVTKMPNYGSLVGRIARLLGVVLEKQQDDKIFVLLLLQHRNSCSAERSPQAYQHHQSAG